jgi:hypothetical protein
MIAFEELNINIYAFRMQNPLTVKDWNPKFITERLRFRIPEATIISNSIPLSAV